MRKVRHKTRIMHTSCTLLLRHILALKSPICKFPYNIHISCIRLVLSRHILALKPPMWKFPYDTHVSCVLLVLPRHILALNSFWLCELEPRTLRAARGSLLAFQFPGKAAGLIFILRKRVRVRRFVRVSRLINTDTCHGGPYLAVGSPLYRSSSILFSSEGFSAPKLNKCSGNDRRVRLSAEKTARF